MDAWGVELELGIENKKLTDLIIPPRLRRLWFLAVLLNLAQWHRKAVTEPLTMFVPRLGVVSNPIRLRTRCFVDLRPNPWHAVSEVCTLLVSARGQSEAQGQILPQIPGNKPFGC